MVASRKSAGKGKGSKGRAKAQKEVVRHEKVEEVQTLLASAPPPEPVPQATATPSTEPQALPSEVTDPQVSNETKEG